MDELTQLQENTAQLIRVFCNSIGVLQQQPGTANHHIGGASQQPPQKLIQSFATDIGRLAAENERLIDALPAFPLEDSETALDERIKRIDERLDPEVQQEMRQRLDQSIQAAEELRTTLNTRLHLMMDEYLRINSTDSNIHL